MRNQLLASLPREHYALLAPHMTTSTFSQNLVLSETGDEVDQI